MKFTQHYTIKWHDTDLNRHVRPSQILMYMQETANRQLADAGLDLDHLRDERGLAFLLSSISIVFHQPLITGDGIDVETWVAPGRGLRYNRSFRILKDGEAVAEANSVWALWNMNEERLMRSEEAPYTLEPEEGLSLHLPPRLQLPPVSEMEQVGIRPIVYSDVDYNGHMNNTHYPDLFCDFTPDICQTRVYAIMLSFLREAGFGHDLTVFRRKTEGGYLFRTVDANGAACTDARLFTEALS